jgi:hypothetical protein
MADERHNPMGAAAMTHAEFEALLAEAIDGALGAAEMERFRAHSASCEVCAPQLVLAEEGRRMLRALPALEPPAYLVQKVLNVTSELAPRAAREKPARDWSFGLRPAFAAIMQPRFGMSFAMAFFSFTLLLNVTNLKISDLQYVDLRPGAVKENVVKGYFETTGRVQKYYENLRFVYQVQSTLRDLRNATSNDEQTPQPATPKPEKKRDDNTSEKPEQKNQRYSLDRPVIQLASARDLDIRFCNDRRTA